jgi:sugar phosphate isomerase/epimerase
MQLMVFTKPWKTLPLAQLAAKVKALGFDGIELPVRPGFQVEPQRVEEDLPAAVKVFTDAGIRIVSVAGPMDQRTVEACGASEVKIIRINLGIDPARGYRACIAEFQHRCSALMPALERAGVTIGLQNHAGNDIGSALGLVNAVEPFDRKYVAAVLDLAHCALAGEPEEIAIDIAWPKLCMVNLKNGIRKRIEDQEGEARWRVTWVGSKDGFASWSKTIRVLLNRRYDGPLCLTAEYSEAGVVDRQIAADVAYARELLAAQT